MILRVIGPAACMHGIFLDSILCNLSRQYLVLSEQVSQEKELLILHTLYSDLYFYLRQREQEAQGSS